MKRPAGIDKLASMLLEKESRAAGVARLLHDRTGQALSAAGFQLHGNPAASEAAASLNQAIDSVREACNQLQSNVVERAGISLALELMAERWQQEHGLRLELILDVPNRLPAGVGHAIYRIVELAVENVSRHSGVQGAEVLLTATSAGSIRGSIRDRGCGFPAQKTLRHPPGTGLVLMEAYASSINLQLHVTSTRGRGTIVTFQTI